MDLRMAEQMVWSEMRHYGLGPEWTFKWNRRTNALGRTEQTYGPNRTFKPGGVIYLSKVLTVHRSAVDVRQTVLHEIAHALVGVDKGHGALWKAQMRKMGARVEVKTNEPSLHSKVAKYKIVCASGDLLGYAHRSNFKTAGKVCKTHRQPVRLVPNRG